MKKQFRIKKSKEIDAIIKNKKSYGNSFFVIYYKENQIEHFRFAMSIGRKYGNSVKRNLIKRQIRAIIRNLRNLANVDYVIVVKPKAGNLSYQEIKTSLENLIIKVNEKERFNGSSS